MMKEAIVIMVVVVIVMVVIDIQIFEQASTASNVG